MIGDTESPLDATAGGDARSLAAKVVALGGRTSATGGRGLSLDVGSGAGWFSYELARVGFQPVMIDLDPRAEKAAARVPGARFHRTSFEELSEPGPFAAIVMSQVLEHALDPMDWLRHAARLLQPGGVLAIALPNFGGIYKILGARDPFLIPPIHLNFFTPRSLRLAFDAADFSELCMDSRSEIAVRGGSHPFSIKRRLIGRVWNALSWVLNPTHFGIMLRGFATPKDRV